MYGRGILGGTPGARGYLLGEESQRQTGAFNMNMAQGIMQQQQAAQINPLQIQLLLAQLKAANAPKGPISVAPGASLVDPANPTSPIFTAPTAPKEPRAPRTQFDPVSGRVINLDDLSSQPIPGIAPQPKDPKAPRTQYDPERGVLVNLDDGSAAPIAGIGPKPEKPTADQQAQVVGVNNTRNAIATYRDSLKNFGALDTLNPAKRAEIGTSYNNMLLQAKEAYRLGVLNGPDYKILQEVITSPTSLMGAVTPKTALEGQLTQLDSILERVGQTAQQGGRTPVQPQGQPPTERRAQPTGFRVLR